MSDHQSSVAEELIGYLFLALVATWLFAKQLYTHYIRATNTEGNDQ